MADKQQIQGWLDKLRAGTLVEADLQQALDRLNDRASDSDSPKRQRLLYLNTGNTGVDSQVLGMALVENGEILEGPDDVDQWPLQLRTRSDGRRLARDQVPGDGTATSRRQNLWTRLRIYPRKINLKPYFRPPVGAVSNRTVFKPNR